jgi:DNA-binding IscR family transcriptional regulator
MTAPATEITEKEEIPAEVVEKLMEEMTDAELADLL